MATIGQVPASTHNSRRRRILRMLLWSGGGLVVCAFILMRVAAEHLSKYDDPARLGGTIHVLKTNALTLCWVEKRTTNASLDIVFIHGSPGGAGMWAPQFAGPFPGANCFAYDRPGFGGSAPAQVQPSLQQQVDALMALVDRVKTHKLLLVGHSYGGPIALLAAIEHPSDITGVVLIGGDVDPSEEKPWLLQYVFGWQATSWLLPRSLRQCNREMLTARRDLLAMQDRLSSLTVPVVMLHGGQDALVPVENVAWLKDQLSRVGRTNQLIPLVQPGFNHFIPWEEPGTVQTAISLLSKQVE